MALTNIHTDRLMLVPVTLEITRALLDGNSSEIEKLGIRTDKRWPRRETRDVLPMINRSLEKDGIPSGFEFWMIVKKDNMHVIGDIGFHGKPNEKGEVEVGFGLVEHERAKGFGSEALTAIMDWLSSQESVRLIKATCSISNKPSARILEKVGMKETSRGQDLIHWEFVKSTRTTH